MVTNKITNIVKNTGNQNLYLSGCLKLFHLILKIPVWIF